MAPPLILFGQCPELEGLRWESTDRLLIGRHVQKVDVVLNDASINPQHAEVVATPQGWCVCDLSSRYGTFVNGEALRGRRRLLRTNDLLQFGRMVLGVTIAETRDDIQGPLSLPLTSTPWAKALDGLESPSLAIKMSGGLMHIQASSQRSWEEAIGRVAPFQNRGAGPTTPFHTLLRACHSVSGVSCLEDLLQSILDDMVHALNAQRGAVVLIDEETGELKLRALSLSRPALRNKGTFSNTLAQNAVVRGESLLCSDAESTQKILGDSSSLQGSMTSVVCALLRTSRKRLGVIHLDRGPLQEPFGLEEFHLADAIAATVSTGIQSTLFAEQQRQQFLQTVTAMGQAMDVRDLYPAHHTHRISAYALLLANQMRVPRDELTRLQMGAPLHDIGKIGIQEAILCKSGPLTPPEFEHMKSHTLLGAAILETVPALHKVVPIARHHHERWDGQGYPDKLERDQISLVARIIAVADAFEAMTSDRPYRQALSVDRAFAELRDQAGTRFDPGCVQAFLEQRGQAEAISKHQDPAAASLEGLQRILQGRQDNGT